MNGKTQEFAWREGERMDKGAFLQASRPIYDEFTKEVPDGGDLIELFGGLL